MEYKHARRRLFSSIGIVVLLALAVVGIVALSFAITPSHASSLTSDVRAKATNLQGIGQAPTKVESAAMQEGPGAAPKVPSSCGPIIEFAAPTNLAQARPPFALAIGDFNGDSRTDLVLANYSDDSVSVLLGNGNGTFQAAATYPTWLRPSAVAVGDFNGDGRSDLVTANFYNNVSVLFGNGDGTFQAAVNYPVGQYPVSVVVSDFNGDGHPDLATATAQATFASVLLNIGNGTFSTAVNYPVASSPSSIAAADFNGDGRTDLVTANTTSEDVSVLLGNGNGTFQAAVNYPAGAGSNSITVGDLNGDARPDLAVANNGVSVLLGNGNGTFAPFVRYAMTDLTFSVAIGDFNTDSHPDLITVSQDANSMSTLSGNGDGTFCAPVNRSLSQPRFVVVGNLNGDSKPDAATANYYSNSVSVLLNTSLQVTATPTAPTATPTAVGQCGLAWRVVPSPTPGTTNEWLTGISAAASNDVWAVGYYPGGGVYRTLTTHWNGTRWSVVPSANLTSTTQLSAVAALSANDAWAVGWYQDGSNEWPLIEHWNGARWSIVPSPHPGVGGNAYAVEALSANDVWAVGNYATDYVHHTNTLVLHWNGMQWSVVPSPNVGTEVNLLLGISAVSPNDIWAVGRYFSGPPYIDTTLTMHWNGAQWSVVPSPSPGTYASVLNGVTAIASNDVWAVGYLSDSGAGPRRAMIQHWNGAQWSIVTSPSLGALDSHLDAISATSATDVWAAGSSGVGVGQNYVGRTLVEHWNGSAWSIAPSANSGTTSNTLSSVSAISPTDVWAGGQVLRPGSTDTYWMLSEHFSDPCGSGATATPTYTATATPTPRCPGERFSDVCPGDYFYTPVLYLSDHGAISGYSDGTFRPYNNTTRGQLSKIVVLAEGWTVNTAGGPHFTDVPATNPFYAFIETAFNRGVISGYSDGTFRWGANVTRGQLSKIVVVAEGWPIDTTGGPHFTDVPATNPFYQFVETAYHHTIISGYSDGTFRPGNDATRGQISKIVYSAITQP